MKALRVAFLILAISTTAFAGVDPATYTESASVLSFEHNGRFSRIEVAVAGTTYVTVPTGHIRFVFKAGETLPARLEKNAIHILYEGRDETLRITGTEVR